MRTSIHNISRILAAICILSIACFVFTDIAAGSCSSEKNVLRQAEDRFANAKKDLRKFEEAGLSGYISVPASSAPSDGNPPRNAIPPIGCLAR